MLAIDRGEDESRQSVAVAFQPLLFGPGEVLSSFRGIMADGTFIQNIAGAIKIPSNKAGG